MVKVAFGSLPALVAVASIAHCVCFEYDTWRQKSWVVIKNRGWLEPWYNHGSNRGSNHGFWLIANTDFNRKPVHGERCTNQKMISLLLR